MGGDVQQVWSAFWRSVETGWPRAVELLENPWARAAGLIVIVYLTIRVITAVYSGDKQGAELGPVAIRPHTSPRYGENTIRLPHELMPMSMDNVSACCRILYVYNDTKGRSRKRVVHTIKDARLSISPVRLPRVQSVIYGQEIPDVPTKRVCFPPVDLQAPETPIPATPERALDYASLHHIIENWTEDDTAAWISVSADVKDEIGAAKIEFIKDRVARLDRAEANFVSRSLSFRRLYANRPNVVGSYYLKFEFSHEPLFVLTRHPDRDLKTTAWLTVLTSMFALIMDMWPKATPPTPPGEHIEMARPAAAPPHTVRAVVPPS